ncbi:gamma-glutamyl-gamma-aminobutyrate hydrolase family protein [Candidatus Gottesmanbacteria bacterium]|nr:gamma-glutamyl-gamma-aminobutyrate hydrolase family protein [Candidatus Gottesmanbacteria bacterium]
MGSSKTVAIFETNPPSPVFNNTPAHASWFETILLKLRPQLCVQTYRVVAGEFPKSLRNIDGIIVTGSSKEVYDGDPWIAETAKWMREAKQLYIPVLGVCFGHQIIAQAFGGKVTKNPKGREIGTCSVSLVRRAADDPLFYGLSKKLSVQESHKSIIIKLPKSAKMLGKNTFGVQAFRLGEDLMWGVQFHPEVSAPILKKVILARKPILNQEGLNAEKIYRSVKPTMQSRKVLKNFLDIVYDHTKS